MRSYSPAQSGISTNRPELERFAGILSDKGRFAQRHYRAGETIVIQGDDESRAFVIGEGWGCISKCLRSGQRQLIEFPLRGDVIDLSLAATGGQEEFSALTDIAVWEGPSVRMEMLAQSEAGVARFLADANRRRHAIFIERLADVALRDASPRIAHFLLETGVRLCLAGLPADRSYTCPLTQQDLADALGMTPIHVNRMLREARTLGLYEFRRGRVEFLDYAATADFAGFDPAYVTGPLVRRAPGRGPFAESAYF
jgi:CRP-like cAMP-binding protein